MVRKQRDIPSQSIGDKGGQITKKGGGTGRLWSEDDEEGGRVDPSREAATGQKKQPTDKAKKKKRGTGA